MFDRSVIKRTGQWWKAVVASAVLVIGTVAMFSGLFLMRGHRALFVLVILGMAGFFIGLTLILLHTGNALEYAPHFFTGLVIVTLLVTTWAISRGRKGSSSPSMM